MLPSRIWLLRKLQPSVTRPASLYVEPHRTHVPVILAVLISLHCSAAQHTQNIHFGHLRVILTYLGPFFAFFCYDNFFVSLK